MEDFESKLRERIDKILQMEGLSQTDFAKKIDVNSANFNQVLLGKRHVQKNLPSKIAEAFPEIRLEWLLYGTGEMYAKDQHLADKTAINEHMAMLPTRPRLPKDAEGSIFQYYKGEKRRLCQERPIIYNLTDYDFSLILKNNRMSPKYERGDEAFFKETDFINEDGGDPEWGEEFLLETDNGYKFKRLYPAIGKNGEECFRCVAYNREEYPDFMIPRKKVHAIYRCVGSLRIK
jgi:transcriptional regulator with XRE-family HTH domain